jgi:two-component system response regulator
VALQPILLVEDEASDAVLLTRAFVRAGVLNPVVHVQDGSAALAYLAGTGRFSDRDPDALPVLVLLDLKLPDLPGFSILNYMRTNAALRRIPVVVLTGDTSPQTVKAAYDAGANSYLVKSAKADDIRRIVQLIRDYWLGVNQTPALVLTSDGE